MAITVTAQQGGTTNPGMCLTVKVLTGQSATQNGQPASSGTTTTPQLSIAAGTGNLVYGAVSANVASTYTPLGNTTFQNNSVAVFGTYRSTSATAGTATYGASAPTVGGAGQLSIAELEIIAASSGSLAEDASSPAVLVNASATVLTTASFTPPPGSLLVAMTDTNGGQGGTLTVSLSDTSGLQWAQMVSVSGSGLGYAGVWIAQVPPAASSSVQPGRTWLRRFRRQQQPLAVVTVGSVIDSTGASLAGAGSVSALAVQAAPAALTAAGTVTGTAVQGAGASPAGAGTVSALAVQQATVTISAAASLSAAAVQGAIASPAGAASLTAPATIAAGATPAGSGSLAGLAVQGGAATLTGAATVTATGAGSAGTKNATSAPLVTALDTSAPNVSGSPGGALVAAQNTSSPGVSDG